MKRLGTYLSITFFLGFILLKGYGNAENLTAREGAKNYEGVHSLQKSSGNCVPAPSDLVSWWPADGNALDIVSSNNGTLQNGATFAPGMVDQAFSLDGVDDYVLLSNLDINTLTFDAWVKRDRTSVPGNFDRLLLSVNDNGWGVYFETDNTVQFTLVGVSNVGSISAITDTDWHHIAVTYDGSKACFYIDGDLDSCPAYVVTFNSLGGNYTIGSRGVSEFFDGLIDEVEVFNRALSASEIQAIYNAGSAGKCKEVTICHMPGTPAEKTLAIPVQALNAHLGHGDTIGPCN